MIEYTLCSNYALLSEPKWKPVGDCLTFKLKGGQASVINVFCPENLCSVSVPSKEGVFKLERDFFDNDSCEGNEFTVSFEGDFGRVSGDPVKLIRVNNECYMIPCLHGRREEGRILRQVIVKAYENALEALERINSLEKGYKTE